jgi:crossover junction endodeoxyribonuclease RuvC
LLRASRAQKGKEAEMDKKFYGGIDPGLTGAIAIVGDRGLASVFDFDDFRGLQMIRTLAEDLRITMEKVSAMPKQGVASMFKFGTNYGTWIGRLEALAIPFDLVTPAKWQKAMFDSQAKRGVDTKAVSLDRARRLFPQALNRLTRKKDHNRAEALLLAEYCRRFYTRKTG